MKKLNYFLLLILFVCFNQCNNKNSELKIDSKKLSIIKAKRIDKVLANMKSGEDLHQKLLQFPELYENFYTRMLRLGSNDELFDSSKIKDVTQNLNLFLNDSTMQFIFKNIDSIFNNIGSYEYEISKAIARYNLLFKQNKKIQIGTFYSNFNATVLESDEIIWIGLDMYLGKDNPIVKLLPTSTLPQYYKDKMEKKYIISDVLFGFLMSSIYKPNGDEFLAKLLSYGKIAYTLELILPQEEEENKFRYSKQELKWCEENETNIWRYIIDNKLLYEKDPRKINIFFSDGPYTKHFGKDSPSGIGIWLGYRMIQDHFKKTNKETLEIISENNLQTLLNTYEPK